VIFVLDRGPGIPEEERDAVFRPFYRLERSRNRRTGGSGLGLAVARQLAVANDMEIHLNSRVGGGTVASIRLPRAQDDGDRDTADDSGPPLQSDSSPDTEFGDSHQSAGASTGQP
jgi:signal transduction histidine kinase